ncbi:MAG: exo-alpha-sialidase [Chloroflexi bacterium]|nr:exo-alpha-sialidase [Chloroflexota bacterium]
MPSFPPRSSQPARVLTALALALALALTSALVALAATLTQVSTDPYTNTTSQHRTEVEPDTFSFGTTIVSAFQVGRFTDGGSTNVGWATSTNGGGTWANGFLPGLTTAQGGTYARASDPSVAYDAAHNVWLISSLALAASPSVSGVAVVASRSTNGGTTWGNPVIVATGGDLDKNWVACDNTSTSPFYGHCYVQWDDHGAGNLIQMSTSTDGGLTWGAARKTANNATGLGGQPVVQSNGTVIVPIANAFETAILAFRSTDGGASWSSTATIAQVRDHTVAGGLRAGPLPSAEIDASGKVYVVWQDCRFRRGCKSNDIVLSTSTDGLAWSSVVRVPIDGLQSGVDHFIPGLGVDRSTSGSNAHLGLTYYYYPRSTCGISTCQLSVGFVSSADGGSHWTPSTQLAGPMALSWLPDTTQGRMVGDYISTSFAGGTAHPVIAVASTPTGTTFNEAMNAPASGLSVVSGSVVVTPSGEHPVAGAASDHAAPAAPLTRR